MGKMRQGKKSLKWDFMKYFLVCAVFIFLGGWLIGSLARELFDRGLGGYEIFFGGEDQLYIEEHVPGENTVPNEGYFLAANGGDLFQFVAIPMWSLACVAVCGTLFYRRKLERPIGILLAASENISNSRLDFSVEIPEQNELGQLCGAFETMREALLENNRELWRQAEERKRLNAAFSHDLRNPVTVLKGSAKIAKRCAADGAENKALLLESLARMETYTDRIERYIEAMGNAGRLEQIAVERELTEPRVLAGELEKALRLIAEGSGRQLSFRGAETSGKIYVDRNVLFQIAENLVSNAVRFAKQDIFVSLSYTDGMLVFEAADDGDGFPAELLKNGIQPFQKGSEDAEHFGMGLYLSELLCKKHGGSMEIENRPAGAAVRASLKIS